MLDVNNGIFIFDVSVIDNTLHLERKSDEPFGVTQGIAFDVYANTIMLVRHVDDYYILVCYHIY